MVKASRVEAIIKMSYSRVRIAPYRYWIRCNLCGRLWPNFASFRAHFIQTHLKAVLEAGGEK